jgi:hypothetical protein
MYNKNKKLESFFTKNNITKDNLLDLIDHPYKYKEINKEFQLLSEAINERNIYSIFDEENFNKIIKDITTYSIVTNIMLTSGSIKDKGRKPFVIEMIEKDSYVILEICDTLFKYSDFLNKDELSLIMKIDDLKFFRDFIKFRKNLNFKGADMPLNISDCYGVFKANKNLITYLLSIGSKKELQEISNY